MSLESKIPLLKDRASMLYQARLFFSTLDLCEVDTPILSSSAPIDLHIDIMQTTMHDGKNGYFHSSPEYAMKRLIAAGMESIYQISHVYRFGEEGRLHNPEFTMVEWYKTPCPFLQIIEDTLAFIHIFLGEMPIEDMSYKDLIYQFTGLTHATASTEQLASYIKAHSQGYPRDLDLWDKDTLLQYIVSFCIEPSLGQKGLFVLSYFPASQAGLSQLTTYQEELVAERFEIYFHGIELANGYHELTDPIEQRKRLESANLQRMQIGKQPLPIDEKFIQALEKGLPDCSGVAVGFDRLMMLRHGKQSLSEAIPFAWHEL